MDEEEIIFDKIPSNTHGDRNLLELHNYFNVAKFVTDLSL